MKIARPISEDFREAAEKWVGLDSAASMLEESKSAYLSQMMLREATEKTSVAKAELLAKGSAEWSAYIKRMVFARNEANLAKVTVDYLRMRHGEAMSDAANERTATRVG